MENDEKFIRSLYGRMAAASTVALAGNFLAQIFGTIIAGNILSDAALAVVGIATPVFYVYGAAGAMLGIGCATLCANHIGKSEFLECRRIFTITYILVFAAAALISAAVLVFIDPIVLLLGASADNFLEVKRYCLAMAVGGVGVMLIFPAFNILRIDGRNKTAAGIFVISGILTVALTYVFLDYLGTGVAGLAAASCIGGGIAGVAGGAVIFAKSSNFKPIRPSKPLKAAKNIAVTGTPGAMEYFCFFACMLALNNLLASKFGGSAVAAYKVADSINSFALILIWGIVGPLTPLAGVFGAERDTRSLRDTLKLSIKWGFCVILPITGILLVFAPRVAGLFGMGAASHAVRIFAISIPLSFLNHILIYLYMGGKKVLLANVLMASRMAVWVVAAAIPLARIGQNAFWWCFSVAEFLTLITALGMSVAARKGNRNLLPLLLIDISAERDGRYVSFSAKPGQAAEAAASVVDFCEANSLSPKTSMAISLAIEEMLVVIFDKSKPESANVRILIVADSDVIILRVRCGGTLFNPVDYARKATQDEALEIMGVQMIMKLAVSLDYRNTFGVNNTTIIIGEKKRA